MLELKRDLQENTKKKLYYYDNSNKLINVEVKKTCSQFPISTIDKEFNDKIETIDF